MVEEQTQIRVKVRTIDNRQHEVFIGSGASVIDFKDRLKQVTGLDPNNLRLIYQGKRLQDSDTLSGLKLSDGHVIQAIEEHREEPEQEDFGDDAYTDMLQWPVEGSAVSLLSRRRRRTVRRNTIDHNERMETVRQNLMTIESLMETRVTDLQDEEQSKSFNFTGRQLQVGQWVDVLDTVDQWLEAQVIDTMQCPNGPKAFIHYIGWPDRWDEWITFDSPRIQPLRTHTVQSMTAPVYSPCLIVPPDTEYAAPPHDLNAYILQSCSLLDQVKGMMDRFYSLSTLIAHETAGERTQFMRDRIRLLADREEEKVPCEKYWESKSTSSRATKGSEVLRQESTDKFQSQPETSDLTAKQETKLLTSQLAPILDRMGRLMTDLAPSLEPRERSPANSQIQVPVMPPPSDLATHSPQLLGGEVNIYVYALFAPPRTQ
mmetsp:Transcript_32996/g.58054  ORF Transcript_32996/g.58054 Transcript_32996/m.58054 type:complete len:430 (+) Transcript_32996:214-1503(+)